jgi:hypothetical protein
MPIDGNLSHDESKLKENDKYVMLRRKIYAYFKAWS